VVCFPRFDLGGFLGAVQHHRSRTLYIVPPIVLALAKEPLVDQFDLAVEHHLRRRAPVAFSQPSRLICLVWS
jgi:hypothetical protein